MRLALIVLCLIVVACSSPSSRRSSSRSSTEAPPAEYSAVSSAPPEAPAASTPAVPALVVPPAAVVSAALPTHSGPCTRMFFSKAGTHWEGSAWWPSEQACEGRNQFWNQLPGERLTPAEARACRDQAYAWAVEQARTNTPLRKPPSRADTIQGLRCEVRHRSLIGGQGDENQ